MNPRYSKIRQTIIDGASEEKPLNSVELLSLISEETTINSFTATLTQLCRIDRYIQRVRNSKGKWVYWYDPSKKAKIIPKRVRVNGAKEVDLAVDLSPPEPQKSPVPVVSPTGTLSVTGYIVEDEFVILRVGNSRFVIPFEQLKPL